MPRKKLTEEEEIARVKAMYEYEHNCRDNGYTVVAGVDEAGRGPLAGPVVAGAVILPEDVEILYLNDSKKLPGRAADRERKAAGQNRPAAAGGPRKVLFD